MTKGQKEQLTKILSIINLTFRAPPWIAGRHPPDPPSRASSGPIGNCQSPNSLSLSIVARSPVPYWPHDFGSMVLYSYRRRRGVWRLFYSASRFCEFGCDYCLVNAKVGGPKGAFFRRSCFFFLHFFFLHLEVIEVWRRGWFVSVSECDVWVVDLCLAMDRLVVCRDIGRKYGGRSEYKDIDSDSVPPFTFSDIQTNR